VLGHTGTSTLHHQVTAQTPGIITWPGVCPVRPNTDGEFGSSRAGVPCKGVVLLPSYAYITGFSRTYGIRTTSASCADSPSTDSFWCTAIGHEEVRKTVVRSPMLVAEGAARDGCGGVT
jgi:hypothetical protein